MCRLPIIIYAMDNCQQRKTEIINYLIQYIRKSDFDEVLYTLCWALGDLVSYFKIDLLKILEDLVTNEETVIRKEALNVFMLMLEHISKEELVNIVIPNIVTVNPKKVFTSKLASLDLMVAVYPLCQLKEQ